MSGFIPTGEGSTGISGLGKEEERRAEERREGGEEEDDKRQGVVAI